MKKRWGIVLIVVLILLMVGRDFLIQEGTYFLLDGIFYPTEHIKYSFSTTSFYWLLHNGLNTLLGYTLFSKLYFIGVLFLSGYLGILFSSWIASFFQMKYSQWIGIFGVLFMMINPVLYERMITQPGVYLAMILLGYGLYFLLKSLGDIQGYRSYIFSGIFFSLSVMVSAHMSFMIGLIVVLYSIIFLRSRKCFWGLIILGSITILGNSNWLIGGFLGQGSTVTDTITTFNQANIDSFLTHALTPFPVDITSLLLYGFWGERYLHLQLPVSSFSFWYVFGILIFLLVMYGYMLIFRKHKKLCIFLLLLGIFSWILASGTNSVRFGAMNQWLFDTIPLYIGLREPQKWIVLLLIVYFFGGVMGGIGLMQLLKKNGYLQYGIPIILFLVLALWVPGLRGGFRGQLKISDYPEEFFTLKSQLSTDHKYLVLPWHSYIACDWTYRKVVANPSKGFFELGDALVSADNIEIGGLYTNYFSQQSQDIEQFLYTQDLTLLRKHDFTDIVFLDRCADYKKYMYLEQLSGVQKVFSSPFIDQYKIINVY